MDSLSKDDNKLFQNSISYLHNISSLNFNPSAAPALKCLFLTKARLLELRRRIHVPVTNSSVNRCHRCLLNLIDGPASFRIKPEEKKTKFAKRILAKSKRNKPLTKYQRKYFNRLPYLDGNQLAITCKYCKKEYCVKLDKPKDINSKPKQFQASKKRKSKKKDKFCGLNQDVVLSLTPENVRSLDTSDFLPLNPNKKPRFKLSKKEVVSEPVKEVKIIETVKETRNKLKRKNKLKEFLNTSATSKSKPSANLKHFLQNL